jgi:MoaA/NifB/PqqE/SkfB family radical SAM enzyme
LGNSIEDRIDNVTGLPEGYRAEIVPAPISVKLELTSRCNYRCSFCVKSIRPDSADMDRAFFSRIIRELKDAGVRELGMFFIGESMLCPWLAEAIEEAKSIGFEYVFLTTNGAACTPEKVEACMKAGLDSLKFSLNFSDAEQLKTIAKVSPRNWSKALDAVRYSREIRDRGGYGTRIYASSIAFDGTQGELMRDVIDSVKPYCDSTYWLPLYGMSGAAKNAGWKPQPGNPGRLDNMRDPLPCWSVFTETRITRDGKVAACCFGSGIDGDLIMGDLNEQPFMDIWNSPRFQELRRAHLARDVSGTGCAGCAAA